MNNITIVEPSSMQLYVLFNSIQIQQTIFYMMLLPLDGRTG
jgi:hypothetical protein